MNPALLLVTHGTRSADGRAMLDDIAAHVQAARPDTAVSLCFLDVLEPDLPTALDEAGRPVVLVPVLLSTGYHVQRDIPAVVAGRPDVHIARHLGPHLAVALAERLRDAVDPLPETIALVGTGSSDPGGYDDLVAAGLDLQREIQRDVTVLTMADDVAAQLAELAADGPLAVASYLVAEGFFAQQLRAKAATAGVEPVSAPIGAHPALVDLVIARYDAVIGRPGFR